MSENQQSTSSWMATRPAPAEAKTLNSNIFASVCVIGGGIAGLSTAYLLAREGKDVVLITEGEIGGSNTNTARTTAHLTNAVDDHYCEIEDLHGEDNSRLVAQSHTEAISRIEEIVKQEKIDCDFERLDGYLFLPPDEAPAVIYNELAAAHRAGLDEVELLPKAPIKDYDTGPCLRFPNQGQFHPLKYLAGLAKAIEDKGGKIFTNTRATRIQDGPRVRVETDQGFYIKARDVVLATNSPVNDLFTWSSNDLVGIHTKQAAYRSYVVAARVPQGAVPKALFWDTLDPYHYIRLQSMPASEGEEAYDLLLVGGEDHKTGQEDDGDRRFARLEAWTQKRFPAVEKFEFRWSGQVYEPVDGLAFIGRDTAADHIYIATGDSGMGMTHGTIAGILLTDLILGRKNPWTNLYHPGRVTVGAASEFIKEGANTVSQYADWLTGGDVDSVRQIKPGDGAIIRDGLKKKAVFRDEQGRFHVRSAVCPHQGCIVAWNSTETSWDCPCHGSRFDPYGKMLNGPSIHDLGDGD